MNYVIQNVKAPGQDSDESADRYEPVDFRLAGKRWTNLRGGQLFIVHVTWLSDLDIRFVQHPRKAL